MRIMSLLGSLFAPMQSKTKLSDNDYYRLFRGDSGLPIGMLPLSPYARRLLWQGYSLEKILKSCKLEIDQLYRVAYDEQGWIERALLEFTEVNHFKNPFTSTTDNIQRAIWYATRQYTIDSGYISVLWIKRSRCTRFRQFAEASSTQAENEYGIDGLLLPQEIHFQIPIKDIDVQFYTSSQMSNADLISHFLSTYTRKEFVFRPADKHKSKCPACHTKLSDYLGEVLGFDPKSLQEFIPPRIEQPKKKGDPLPYEVVEINEHLEALALHGMIVRCSRCGHYICHPERLKACPLKIMEITYEAEQVTLRMQNASDEPICYVVLEVSYEIDGKRTTDYYERNLNMASEDLMFSEIGGLPPDMRELLHSVVTGLYDRIKDTIGDGNILPGKEAIHRFWLDYDPTALENLEIIVYRVHFASGRSWLSPAF